MVLLVDLHPSCDFILLIFVGMPGWKALVEPIFRHIDPDLVPALPSNIKSPDFIVNLSGVKPLTSAEDLATAVNRLSVLISSHPNPSLTKRLLKPILLPLWALSSWPVEDGSKGTTTVHEQSRSLVKALIQLTTNGSANKDLSLGLSPVVQDIFNNIQFKGRWVHTDIPWEYATNEKGEIQIQTRTKNVDDSIIEAFQRIDVVVSAFVGLLGSIPDTSPEISALFLQLFRKWSIASRKTKPQVILHLEPWEDTQDIHKKLIETKMLQHLIDTFPDNLVDDASQVLEITGEILSQADIETHQDMLAVALSLLNTVLMSPKFKTSIAIEDMLNGIQNSLAGISRSQADISTTAKNLQMLLKFRRAMEEPDQSPSPKLNPQIEDRKTYQLALSYLTALDSPPPVRVQGLDLFSGLIKTSSPVLDIPSLLILLSSLLQDSEEYLYLRTIRSFIELSERHPRTVLKDLVERYVDSQEESELDQRLRFGEAILQVIQNRPMALVHETSKIVCEGLLFIASRRGYRPKTEQTQQRREKLKKQKDEEADEAWDRDVPQLDEVLEIPTEEDKETMAQIVGGWESKRGSEDVRIRTSALAILAEAIEINIDGIIPQILSAAVDLCIYILTLEPEPEKGILRRSAILMILSFAKALDKARQEGKKLSFGFVGQSLEDVQRILAYVEGSDNDGLVRRHARDVIESLQAWQMSALAPSTRNQQSTGLQNLAGLSVNPMTERNLSGRSRPRIEEIE